MSTARGERADVEGVNHGNYQWAGKSILEMGEGKKRIHGSDNKDEYIPCI